MPLPKLADIAAMLSAAAGREANYKVAAACIRPQKKAREEAERRTANNEGRVNVQCYLPAEIVYELGLLGDRILNQEHGL